MWLGSVAIALVVGLLAHLVLFFILKRLARLRAGVIEQSIVSRCAKPAALLIPLIFAMIVETPEDALALVLSIRRIIVIGIIIAIAWMLVALTYVFDDFISSRFDITARDNLKARTLRTKYSVFRKFAAIMITILAAGAALMTFPMARQIGAGILASAGIAGIVIGFAAQAMLGNLLAGVQIALSETLKIDDAVIVKGEWGRVEEINATNVVVRIWDLRRLIVPISYFIKEPFENWTWKTSRLLGTAFLHCDYTVPVAELREEFLRFLKTTPKWDGEAAAMQVVDTTERTMTIRCLMSAADSGTAFELRCEVREHMIDFLQRNYPKSLPRTRTDVDVNEPLTIQRPDRPDDGASRSRHGADARRGGKDQAVQSPA